MLKVVLALYAALTFVVGTWLYQKQLLVTPGLFVLGSVVFGFGLWLFFKQITVFSKTRKTFGKLVGWGEEKTPNPASPRTYYYMQVVFEAPDGTQHQVTSATGDRIKLKSPIGTSMPVRYDPSNPEEARLDTLFDFWGPSVITLFFGAVTCAMAFVRGGH